MVSIITETHNKTQDGVSDARSVDSAGESNTLEGATSTLDWGQNEKRKQFRQ